MNSFIKKYNKRQDCYNNLILTDQHNRDTLNETFITDTNHGNDGNDDDDDKLDVIDEESSILTLRHYQQREEITDPDTIRKLYSIKTIDEMDEIDDETDDEISNTMRMEREIASRPQRSISTPNDDGAKQLLLINIKHKVIAEQLTVIMHDIYVNIPFDNNHNNNYYTDSYTKIFNQIVKWIQYSILVAVNSKQRAQIIKKWIKACDYLLALRNFHALVAIHCALMSNCVYSGKLKIAWFSYKNIIKKKHHDKLAQIGEIVSYNDNFKILRDKISDGASPILPYWGIFKRDCQFLAEYKNGENTINILMESLMAEYDEYKKGEYSNLKRDKLIEAWIHHKLDETSMITIQAMDRMSDNIRDLDEKIKEKRRHSLIGRISELK